MIDNNLAIITASVELSGLVQLSRPRDYQCLSTNPPPWFWSINVLWMNKHLCLEGCPKGGFIPDYHAPGDIASRDIKSPRELLVEDVPLTREKQDEAWDSVPPPIANDPARSDQSTVKGAVSACLPGSFTLVTKKDPGQ